jgi:hypothetical protein
MIANSVYRKLHPNAPRSRRTEKDIRTAADADSFAMRRKLRPVTPGLQSPRLISSFQGTIERILLTLPESVLSDARLEQGYRSVIRSLRQGTNFIVVHSKSHIETIRQWFTDAGHPGQNIIFVPLDDYVKFTDWAEDAYVALSDDADGSSYLMEPWEFPRAGDALIADAVEEHSDISASQAPLIFQGGNCLIGDDFWFLGRDYMADTVGLFDGGNPPVELPDGMSGIDFARRLFSDYVDKNRKLILIGTEKPIPLKQAYGLREGARFLLDVPAEGVGTYQPIFHIDMFISLVGRQGRDKFTVLVGDPGFGEKMTGDPAPYGLATVYDAIAEDLRKQGFDVLRNPLVHWRQETSRPSYAELLDMSRGPDGDWIVEAVKDLGRLGAKDDTPITVRVWHHITWNNCLVEAESSDGSHVYLPTFGHGQAAKLKVVDDAVKSLWEENLGFTTHMLDDFNAFAERQGVVHCIKKYVRRGDPLVA